MVHGRLEKKDNSARYVNVNVFGEHNYHSYPDPEGLVSTLPAIASGLIGLLAGRWLKSERRVELLHWIMCWWSNGGTDWRSSNSLLMPINKQIWTPSYVFLAAGIAPIILAILFLFRDILLICAGYFYRLFGMG